VVATSAARDAGNAVDFMLAAQAVTGVRPEVLSGVEEGRLSFLGSTAHVTVPDRGNPILVTDIGGGSTELSVGTPPQSGVGGGAQVATRSLDVGCVRVTERFLRHDPPRPEEVDEARTAIEKDLVRARDELPTLSTDSLLIGLAGTVSTLSSLVHGIATYDRSAVHHSTLSREDVERWLSILRDEKAKARLAHPGMVEGREDVIVGGAVVLAAVMSVFERDRCLVSEDDILDGMASDLLSR
jgi:exopolyphosphatase/guanosine-5'-triphosphate,3'-diphosphate pyrophosphatase